MGVFGMVTIVKGGTGYQTPTPNIGFKKSGGIKFAIKMQ
jgi:hypothetical protein